MIEIVIKDKLIQKLLHSQGYVNHQLNWWTDMEGKIESMARILMWVLFTGNY